MPRHEAFGYFLFSLLWHSALTSFFFCFTFPPHALTPLSILWIALHALMLQSLLHLLLLPLLALSAKIALLSLRLALAFCLFCILLNIPIYQSLSMHLDDEIVLEHLLHPKTLTAINLSWLHLLLASGFVLFLILNLFAHLRLWQYLKSKAEPSQKAPQRKKRLFLLLFVLLLGNTSAWLLFPAEDTALERYLFLFAEAKRWKPQKEQSLYARLDQRQIRLRYPLSPLPQQLPLTNPQTPDILMVLSDTLRQDMTNAQDMPFLYNLSQKQPTLQADYSYSGSHLTVEACFTLFYSLFGYHRIFFSQKPYQPLPLVLLKRLGYKLVALNSSSFDARNFPGLRQVFDQFEELSGGGLVAMEQRATQRAIEIFNTHRAKSKQPLFVMIFYFTPHFPYPFPPQHAIHRPYFDSLHIDPKDVNRLELWHRYRNSTRFLDAELQRLFTAIEEKKTKRPLSWVVLGDHGEEFWEHGQFGHADRRTIGMRTRSAFVLHFPTLRESKRVRLAHHTDVFPTLLDLIGLKLPPERYSDGSSLLQPRRLPFLHVNTFHFPRYRPFTLVTDKYQLLMRRDSAFRLHVEAVLDLEDRLLPSPPKAEIAQIIAHWRQEVDRFYPQDRLVNLPKILYTQPADPASLPRAPLPNRLRDPSLRPWNSQRP